MTMTRFFTAGRLALLLVLAGCGGEPEDASGEASRAEPLEDVSGGHQAERMALEAGHQAERMALEAEREAERESLQAEMNAEHSQERVALEAELEAEREAEVEALQAEWEAEHQAKLESLEAERMAGEIRLGRSECADVSSYLDFDSRWEDLSYGRRAAISEIDRAINYCRQRVMNSSEMTVLEADISLQISTSMGAWVRAGLEAWREAERDALRAEHYAELEELRAELSGG